MAKNKTFFADKYFVSSENVYYTIVVRSSGVGPAKQLYYFHSLDYKSTILYINHNMYVNILDMLRRFLFTQS